MDKFGQGANEGLEQTLNVLTCVFNSHDLGYGVGVVFGLIVSVALLAIIGFTFICISVFIGSGIYYCGIEPNIKALKKGKQDGSKI